MKFTPYASVSALLIAGSSWLPSTNAFAPAVDKPPLVRATRSRLHAESTFIVPTEIITNEPDEKTNSPGSQWDVSLEENRRKAKLTWETIALSEAQEMTNEVIDMRSSRKARIYDSEAFDRFASQVKGTYFLNGLGSCAVGDRLVHPFEAPGFLKSLAFQGDGTIIFQSSFVNTPLTKLERGMGKMLAKGVMSSVAPYNFGGAFWNALAPGERNTANLAVVMWPPAGSKVDPVLIVGGDNSHPYVVDPNTLQTLGPLDQVVGVGDIREVLKGRKMLAHTRVDEKRERLIMCTSTMKLPGEGRGGGNTILEFFEFDRGFKLVSSQKYVADFMVFHDWMITEDYYVVPKNPAVFQPEGVAQYLMGMCQGTECFRMDEDVPGAVLLIPREPSNGNVIEAEADAFFNIFHLGPCFQEDEDDDLVVIYGSTFDSYKFGAEMGFDAATQKFDPIAWSASPGAPAPRLDKFVIDRREGKIVRRERIGLYDDEAASQGTDIPVDMPVFRTDGAKMRYSYFSGAARPEGWFPFRSILKVDLETGKVDNWDAGCERVVSEALFVPTGEKEDEGFVMSIVHCAETRSCELVVWDAERFGNGPIGAVDLGSLMPWCVHGSWTSYVPQE